MKFIGIDPGKSGAIAVIDAFASCAPEIKLTLPAPMIDKEYNVGRMFDLLEAVKDDSTCVIERAQAMPGQGVTSMFSIGYGFGLWLGILAALKIPFKTIHPRVWQKNIMDGIPTADNPKARALIAFNRLFPKDTGRLLVTPRCRKPHDGIVDAVLLAEYCRRVA